VKRWTVERVNYGRDWEFSLSHLGRRVGLRTVRLRRRLWPTVPVRIVARCLLKKKLQEKVGPARHGPYWGRAWGADRRFRQNRLTRFQRMKLSAGAPGRI
jgi:hypothetical protein